MGSSGCQRFSNLLVLVFGALALAAFIASLNYPWYVLTTRFNGGCTVEVFTNWTANLYACHNCGIVQPLCKDGYSSIWDNKCVSPNDPSVQGENYCLHQYYVWKAAFGLTITNIVLLGIAGVSFLLFIFGCVRHTWTFGLLVLAVIISFVILMTFSIGLPMATNRDTNDRKKEPASNTCDNGPCRDFIGSESDTLYQRAWGPGAGWALCLGASGATLIAFLILAILHRQGRHGYKHL